MGFEGFVRVYNNSGEEYEDAQVRLIVGRINLSRRLPSWRRFEWMTFQLKGDKRRELREKSMREAVAKDEEQSAMISLMPMAPAAAFKRNEADTKEGLSEYLSTTIEGRNIRNVWSKDAEF